MSRTDAEHLRIYGPPEFREWVDLQECLVDGCTTKPGDWRPDGRGYREICHARNGGTGRKANWNWTFVACWRHHDKSGEGVVTFAYEHQLRVSGLVVFDLMKAAVQTHAAFMLSDLGRSWAEKLEAGTAPPTGDLLT